MCGIVIKYETHYLKSTLDRSLDSVKLNQFIY